MMLEYVNLLNNVVFPIVCVIYLVTKFEKKIQQNTKATEANTKVITKLHHYIQNMKI